MKLFSPSSSSHWYAKDGSPVHTVQMKTDPTKQRPTTVRDARELGLLPSVTNIIGILDKPALTAWKQEQAVLAAITLPRNPGEGDDDFAIRVTRDATEQVSDAASIGVKMHAAVATLLTTGRIDCDDAIKPLFAPVIEWSDKHIGYVHLAEQTVVGDGYAGQLDLVAELDDLGPCIIDFKTRKRYNGKFATYDEDGLQLAAYQAAVARGHPHIGPLRRVSVLIDSQNPSEPHLHVWPSLEDHETYTAFMHIFCVWKFLKSYNP
jgi:hypothetical protein